MGRTRGHGLVDAPGYVVVRRLLGVILYVIVSGVSRFGRRRDDDDALEILKRRYARGELSAEEFEHMRQELT